MILLQMAPLGIQGTLPSACVWDGYLNTWFLMTKINDFFKEDTLGACGMQTLKCLLVCVCLWKTNKHIYKFMSSYLILWIGNSVWFWQEFKLNVSQWAKFCADLHIGVEQNRRPDPKPIEISGNAPSRAKLVPLVAWLKSVELPHWWF